MADAAISVRDGSWILGGDLDFETVPALLKQEGLVMGDGEKLTIDLSGVGRVDSAGLALMIEWLREAQRTGLAMEFIHVPDQLRSIARVCGLDAILFAPGEAR